MAPITIPNIGAMADGAELSSIEAAQLEKGREERDAEWKPGPKEWALMITLGIISLMVALDATILVSVLPTLAVDLGGSATDAFWAGTSYLLACAVCQPFIAALSDIFGRKEMLMTSVLLFTLGTAVCAPIAKDFSIFFFGRAIQGLGGGGIITMGQVIFADVVPLRQRPRYFSIVLAAWAFGSVLGPLIGGLFVQHVVWAWCFYINVFPFCVLGLVLVPIYVRLKTKKTSLMSKLARVDWTGSFLFTASMTSFLVGISWAGIQFDWKSAQVIAPIIVGVIGVVLTIIWEAKYAKEPIIRPSLFNSRSAILAYVCALFQGLIIFCILYYIPFYFTAVRFASPTQAGLDVFPVTVFLLPGSIVVSIITSRIGRFRWAIWGGWAISALACGLFEIFDQDTSTPVWAVVLALFGIGMGMLLTSINVGIQAISSVEDAGRAAAMYAFMRTIGMSIGVAIGGTTFQNVMRNKLRDLGLPESIARDSEAFVRKMETLDPTDPLRVGALEAYVTGFHGVYWIVVGVSIAGFIISLGIKKHTMDKVLESKFVLRGGRSSTAPILTNGNLHTTETSPTVSEMTDGSIITLPYGADLTAPPNIFKEGRPRAASNAGSTCSCRPGESAKTSGPEPMTKAVAVNQVPPLIAEEQATAVAYYIEPGGGVTQVDILATPKTKSPPEPQPPQPAAQTIEMHEDGNSQHLVMGNAPEMAFTVPSRSGNKSPWPPAHRSGSTTQESAEASDEPGYDWTDPDSLADLDRDDHDLRAYRNSGYMVRSESAGPEPEASKSRRETLEPADMEVYLGRRSWS